MNLKRKPWALAWIVLVGTSMMPTMDGLGQRDLNSWKRHRDAVLKQPGLARYYTFEDAVPGAANIANLAGGDGALVYRSWSKSGNAPESLRVVEGRWPGKKAVRLDAGSLNAEPVDIAGQAFTVTGWFRKNGPGIHRGNNDSPNGTLLSTGDGYWSGWRVTTWYPGNHLSFEIGRPKPSSSIGVSGGLVGDGGWHHLAAAWDGRQMRLYCDGLPVATGDYGGDYNPPKGASFRLGFNDAGVGSVVLDCDEVAVFARALTPAEILRDAFFHVVVPDWYASRMESVCAALLQKNPAGAEKELSLVLERSDLPSDLAVLAWLKRGELLLSGKKPGAAAESFLELTESQTAPANVRHSALWLLQKTFAENPAAPYPAKVYEKVLDLPGPSPEQKRAARMNTARAQQQSGNLAGARAQYEAVAQSPDLNARERADAILALGHVRFEMKDYAAARIDYEKIATRPDLPPHYRSLALLRIAQSHVREMNSSLARESYRKVQTLAGAPASHIWEAGECARELARVETGLAPRDPLAGRIRLPATPTPGLVLQVAPNGDDANPGTAAKPFATLSRARDEIRARKQAGPLPAGGITVTVHGGSYRVREMVRLGKEDSGLPESPVIYQAQAGEQPQFTGGVRLTGFELVRDPAILARLPEASRGKVWQVDLRALGIDDWGAVTAPGKRADLYFSGKLLPLARWPNQDFVRVGDLLGEANVQIHGLAGAKEGKFTYAGDRPNRWGKETEIWLYGYWFWDWADSYQKVASIDTDKHAFALAPPHSGYGYRKGQRYYALNLLSEIDQPGEWYLDRAAGILYLQPPGNLADAAVELALFNGPMLELDNVSHVRLHGLTFECGRGDAAVVNGGDSVLFAGCTFRRFGENGIVVNGGRNHGIFGCDIHTLGRGGTRLIGGDRKTLSPSGHFLENCHIHDFSRFIHTYTPAVFCDGVGHRIAHNLFHDSPSSAMRLEGNDHLIEFNEIHNVVTESDDQGGADMWGNPSYRGVLFRYNYWHDIGNKLHTGAAGIRLDDAICQVLIYGNVFYRCADGLFGGVQIHGGKENVVENNLFVDCQGAVSFSAWGEKRWKEFLARPDTIRKIATDVNISQPPYSTRYPLLARLSENADHNFIWRNLVVNCGQFLMRDRGVNDLLDNFITNPDPGFADAANGDFQIRDVAPIYDRFSFRPIPFGEIGLYPHESAASRR